MCVGRIDVYDDLAPDGSHYRLVYSCHFNGYNIRVVVKRECEKVDEFHLYSGRKDEAPLCEWLDDPHVIISDSLRKLNATLEEVCRKVFHKRERNK